MSGIRSSSWEWLVWCERLGSRGAGDAACAQSRDRQPDTPRGPELGCQTVTVSLTVQIVDVLAGDEICDGAGGHGFLSLRWNDVPPSYG
jgi:hypothetical protein